MSESEKEKGLSRPWMLVALILASSLIFLSGSVVNVALPAIGRSFEAGLTALQWIVDGYVLTLASLMLLSGSLGDRYGRQRVMLVGLLGFGATALACGLAPSVTWLIGARLLQGIAGALVVPGSLAILRDVYTDPKARGQAIGRWSGWSGLATVVGPPLGGWLVDVFSWRWAFFLVVPLAAVAAGLVARYVPHSRSEDAGRLDWAGAALITLGLGGVIYGLIEGPVAGWTSLPVLVALIGGAGALLLFPFVETRVSSPMVPLDMFRSSNFTGANLTTLGVYFGLLGMNFFVVLYLQNVAEYSALEAGLALAPTSLLLLLLSPRFGAWAGRYGPRRFMTGGALTCAAGLLLFTRLDPQSDYWIDVLPAVVVFGLGLSAIVAPLTNTVMGAVGEGRSGVAAAVNNTVSRMAGLLAVAGLGVVLALSFRPALDARTEGLSSSATAVLERTSQNLTGRVDTEQLPPQAAEAFNAAYTAAFRRTMLVAAGMAAAGGIVAALMVED